MLFSTQVCIKLINLYKNVTRLTMNKTKCSAKKPINKGNLLQSIPVSTQGIDEYRVLATPVKSESDKKDYKVIQLANGLTACLISDKTPIVEDEDPESEEYDSEEPSGTEESEGKKISKNRFYL